LDEGLLEEKYDEHEAVQNLIKDEKAKKEDVRQLSEFVTVKKPKKPYEALDEQR
jgi:hypothetical protein